MKMTLMSAPSMLVTSESVTDSAVMYREDELMKVICMAASPLLMSLLPRTTGTYVAHLLTRRW